MIATTGVHTASTDSTIVTLCVHTTSNLCRHVIGSVSAPESTVGRVTVHLSVRTETVHRASIGGGDVGTGGVYSLLDDRYGRHFGTYGDTVGRKSDISSIVELQFKLQSHHPANMPQRGVRCRHQEIKSPWCNVC